MVLRESFEDRETRLTQGGRVRAAREFLDGLLKAGRLGDDASYALAMLIVDATLDGDEVALHAASRQLQSLYRVLARSNDAHQEGVEDRGRVLAFLDVAAWGLERALSLSALAELERNSAAHGFLRAVVERPGMTNVEIAREVGIADAEASRLGRRLADAGLVGKRRLGRRNHWEVTPKGLQALDLLETGASRHRRPDYQLQ